MRRKPSEVIKLFKKIGFTFCKKYVDPFGFYCTFNYHGQLKLLVMFDSESKDVACVMAKNELFSVIQEEKLLTPKDVIEDRLLPEKIRKNMVYVLGLKYLTNLKLTDI